VVNGNFSAGMGSWQTFGQIVSQIAGGVFEFYRPPGDPAGVVLQGTGQTMNNNQPMVADFLLGNSSNVRRRATVLIHDGNFSDLSACSFWLPPNMPLSQYTIKTFATKAWTNATVSVYAASVGTEQWFQLDDVVLRTASGQTTIGTACLEPDLSEFGAAPALSSLSTNASARPVGPRPGTSVPTPTRSPESPNRPVANSGGIVDRESIDPVAMYLGVPPSDTDVDVQISADGETWTTVARVRASSDWTVLELRLRSNLLVRTRPAER
jgi:hypothetical protein